MLGNATVAGLVMSAGEPDAPLVMRALDGWSGSSSVPPDTTILAEPVLHETQVRRLLWSCIVVASSGASQCDRRV